MREREREREREIAFFSSYFRENLLLLLLPLNDHHQRVDFFAMLRSCVPFKFIALFRVLCFEQKKSVLHWYLMFDIILKRVYASKEMHTLCKNLGFRMDIFLFSASVSICSVLLLYRPLNFFPHRSLNFFPHRPLNIFPQYFGFPLTYDNGRSCEG